MSEKDEKPVMNENETPDFETGLGSVSDEELDRIAGGTGLPCVSTPEKACAYNNNKCICTKRK